MKAVLLVVAILLSLLPSSLCWATNGMNTIGFGAISPAMGGADLAAVDNATAMNINPAGLCTCADPELGLGVSLLGPQLHHRDTLGNDRDGEENFFTLPLLTFAMPMRETGLTLGVGVFSQGGMGAEFRELATPFAAQGLGSVPGQEVPSTDKIFSDVRYIKFTPTLAWQTPVRGLRLGVSLNAGYAQTELKFFPNTSVFIDNNGDLDAGDPGEVAFAGLDMRDMRGFGFGARTGFQYQIGALTLGGAYLSETPLDFDDGTMAVNLSAAGLGKVRYDAEMKGFSWPRQAGLGASWRFGKRLRLAADIDWIDWSSAIRTIRIKLSRPDNPAAPRTQEIAFPMNWRDQWVYAVGLEWNPRDTWKFRLGYNHGNSPVPDNTLTPLFPAIIEDHLTGGVGTTFGPWAFDAAVEWGLPAEQRNDNPDPAVNPFGPGTVERHSQVTVHLMARRFF